MCRFLLGSSSHLGGNATLPNPGMPSIVVDIAFHTNCEGLEEDIKPFNGYEGGGRKGMRGCERSKYPLSQDTLNW